MIKTFDIGEVARRTGLTPRALRFYEARGLVAPLRTAGGRRVYGEGELARLNAVVMLKRAGFSIAAIATMLGGAHVDLRRLLAAQREAIEREAREIGEACALIDTVLSRIDRGEPVDVATLCSLIRNGEQLMEPDHWRAVTDRYFTPAEKREWTGRMGQVPDGFDQEAYGRKWKALSARIEAALPLDPASAEAQAFVDAWFALLKPFSEVATPAMWNGAKRLYDDMEAWEGKADPGFGKAVWTFIGAATQARIAAGGRIDGPAWMGPAK